LGDVVSACGRGVSGVPCATADWRPIHHRCGALCHMDRADARLPNQRIGRPRPTREAVASDLLLDPTWVTIRLRVDVFAWLNEYQVAAQLLGAMKTAPPARSTALTLIGAPAQRSHYGLGSATTPLSDD